MLDPLTPMLIREIVRFFPHSFLYYSLLLSIPSFTVYYQI